MGDIGRGKLQLKSHHQQTNTINAFTLLVWQYEGHQACKKLDVGSYLYLFLI